MERPQHTSPNLKPSVTPKLASNTPPPLPPRTQSLPSTSTCPPRTNEVDDLTFPPPGIDNDYFESFPPGYRFCPHDDELIIHYLRKRVNNEPLPKNRIINVNLYRYNPQTLADKYKQYGEKVWYFFTPRDRKYPNGARPNRAAGDGYWKATGADRTIRQEGGPCVGFRKALVFYKGKPPKGEKTNWIMHEFRVDDPSVQNNNKTDPKNMRLDNWVLCRIYEKLEKGGKAKPGDDDNSSEHAEDEREDDANEEPLPFVYHDQNGIIMLDDDFSQQNLNFAMGDELPPLISDQSLAYESFYTRSPPPLPPPPPLLLPSSQPTNNNYNYLDQSTNNNYTQYLNDEVLRSSNVKPIGYQMSPYCNGDFFGADQYLFPPK